MKRRNLFSVLAILALAICIVAPSVLTGCNTLTKSSDGSVSINQPALAADLTLIRSVIASQPPGATRDQLLKDFDQAATIGQIVTVLTAAPADVQAQVPTATVARVKKAATQPVK